VRVHQTHGDLFTVNRSPSPRRTSGSLIGPAQCAVTSLSLNFAFWVFSEVRQKNPEQNCISALTFIADSLRPITMPAGNEPHRKRRGGLSVGDNTRGGPQ
jgi:hypothetical protein